MNIDISQLKPGTPGVSHGSGLAGELIRTATQSWAGHAFMYVGNGLIVQGQPPYAVVSPANSHDDAIWFYKMWDQVVQDKTAWKGNVIGDIATAQKTVVARSYAQVGTSYDYPAYIGFGLECTHLRTGSELDPIFKNDTWRVCSALVDDALTTGGLVFDWELLEDKHVEASVVNLVSPAMLEDYAVLKGWL